MPLRPFLQWDSKTTKAVGQTLYGVKIKHVVGGRQRREDLNEGQPRIRTLFVVASKKQEATKKRLEIKPKMC